MLEHSIGAAVETDADKIVIVLGANSELIEKEIQYETVSIVVNPQWAEGMASSIRTGLSKLLEIAPGVQSIIIMVCDQPFVTPSILKMLVAKYLQNGKPIVASKYAGTNGTPALFDKTMFAALLALTGDAGAKKILNENPDWLDTVDFPLGQTDIDTALDYNALVSTSGETG